MISLSSAVYSVSLSSNIAFFASFNPLRYSDVAFPNALASSGILLGPNNNSANPNNNRISGPPGAICLHLD